MVAVAAVVAVGSAVEVVAVADRSETVAGGEEEPAAPEEVHIRLTADPGCTKGCNADPYSAGAGRSRVDLFVPEVEVDELLGPSPLESCPLPPASPWRCTSQILDHSIFPNLVPRGPVMKMKID